MREQLLTCYEVAEQLRMSYQFVTRECREGRLRAYRMGSDWRIPVDALQEYIEQRKNAGQRQPEAQNDNR